MGLELARRFKPEVALVDLAMPGMNGFELAERLRSLDTHLQLIAVSGYSGEEARQRARNAHFDGFVVKPFDPQSLDDLLSRPVR